MKYAIEFCNSKGEREILMKVNDLDLISEIEKEYPLIKIFKASSTHNGWVLIKEIKLKKQNNGN